MMYSFQKGGLLFWKSLLKSSSFPFASSKTQTEYDFERHSVWSFQFNFPPQTTSKEHPFYNFVISLTIYFTLLSIFIKSVFPTIVCLVWLNPL